MSASVVQLARGWHNNYEALAELPTPVAQVDHESPVEEQLQHLRPELYGLVAVVADQVVNIALADRDLHAPYGLTSSGGLTVERLSSVDDFNEAFKATLMCATRHTMDRLETRGSPLYKRLSSLCLIFYEAYEGQVPRYWSATELIKAGAGTAANAIDDCLVAVNCLVRAENPTAGTADVARVARSSYRLPTKLAGIGLAHLEETSELIQSAGLRTNDTNHGVRLVTRHDGQAYVDFTPIAHNPAVIPQGCPARIRLDGLSAIEKLWGWAVDIAEAHDFFLNADQN